METLKRRRRDKRCREGEGLGLPWTFLLGTCPALGLLLEHLAISAASHQVTRCLRELEGQLQALAEACALRQERCEENWGLQKRRQELEQAEAWLASREGLLLDPNCGVSHP